MQYSRYAKKLTPVFKNKVVTTYSPSLFNLTAVIVFIIFAIHPTIKTIIALQKTIDDQKQTLTSLQAKSKSLADGISNYNQISDDTKIKLIMLLPSTTNLTCLVNDLNNGALASGSTVSGLQVQPTELKGVTKCILDNQDLDHYRKNLSLGLNLNEITFTINTSAQFAQLSTFLHSFNSSTRLLNIQSATFNKPTEGGLVLVVNAKGYYYK